MARCCEQPGYKKCLMSVLCIGFATSILWMFIMGNGFNLNMEMLKNTFQRRPIELSIRKGNQSSVIANHSEGESTTPKETSARKQNTSAKVRKLILLKNNPRWSLHSIVVRQLSLCSAKCTLVKSGNNLSAFDAIIFNAVGYPENLPPRKVPGQVWIYFTLESPYYSDDYKFNRPEWRHKFNWTMTYRADSDIWNPYGRILKREKPIQLDFKGLTKNKTKLAAWFVSNCRTPGERHKYVQKMKKTISVDIFGGCGDKKCPSNNGTFCGQMLSRDYKFYLAFENSLCYDYLTEKVFQYITQQIVLVVRGGGNYSKFLPPNSFINTADFKSPKLLAEYLLYLDKNHTAYVEYFKWRNHYYVGTNESPGCLLCKKLSNATAYANVYNDIYSWWHKDTCKQRQDLSA
ncbi:alpha-(1,3)-fucosyltransferase C-like [Gigantopelta aegis]|uniref:alpha-(1,3)-fucosyltransferase C-like n=1 Tax=Gigantopelta aegis TaxID=1735272 RepID=UPI001B889EF5|nr:alpha-(1,3)-fucosyltransferase C-like [Gigantopelta aegis]